MLHNWELHNTDARRTLRANLRAEAERLTADRDIVLGALEGHAFDNSTFDAIDACTTLEGRSILTKWQKEVYHREEYKAGMA